MKTLRPEDLLELRAHCVLANAYHLSQRPGAEQVASLGGLHRFMSWSGPMLTDSGGFQVHSLAELRLTTEDGVAFRSHLDGSLVDLTPERVVRIQELLGADLIMPLDVCLGPSASRAEVSNALERTHRWAGRSAAAASRHDQQLFGIVQGGLQHDLRREAARDLQALDFPGYAIGGLSVGEPVALTDDLVATTVAELPADRPRYLMGVGTPEQLLDYIRLGIDLFDCVLPTRLGRTGMAFTNHGRLNLKRADCADDARPVDESCDCVGCQRFSRAYLHRALRDQVALGARLLSIHNLRTLVRCAEEARQAVLSGAFAEHYAARRRQPAGQPSAGAKTCRTGG